MGVGVGYTRNVAFTTRPCGLYRTTEHHPEHPIGPALLVRFHNHSDQGPPIVLLPESNRENRWHFHHDGYLIEDPAYLDTLVSLLPEGLYRLRDHFHPDDERIVENSSLVQLGYNRAAEPILFFPSKKSGENAFEFPSRGMKIGQNIYELLERLDTRGPFVPKQLH